MLKKSESEKKKKSSKMPVRPNIKNRLREPPTIIQNMIIDQ